MSPPKSKQQRSRSADLNVSSRIIRGPADPFSEDFNEPYTHPNDGSYRALPINDGGYSSGGYSMGVEVSRMAVPLNDSNTAQGYMPLRAHTDWADFSSGIQSPGIQSQVPSRLLSSPRSGAGCVLQFASQIFFLEEEEVTGEIDVMRLGDLSERVSCLYYTEDGSGKAGDRYEAASGELVFEPGESSKGITLTILPNDFWSATLEFKVVLSSPRNCELGQFLKVCRVKVIDNDTFPTSKYPEVAGDLEDISSLGVFPLLAQFCTWNFHQGDIGAKTILCLIFDQMKNMFLLYRLLATTFLLNEVLTGLHENPDFSIDERTETAVLIGAGWILPMVLLHAWDYAKEILDIGGQTQANLQKAILRKYMNYDLQSQSQVDVARLISVLNGSSASASRGYVALLALTARMGKMGIITFFIWKENRKSLGFASLMPISLLIWTWFRSTSLQKAMKLPTKMNTVFMKAVVDIVHNYAMISSYRQRPKMNDDIARKVDLLRDAQFAPNSVRINNEYFVQWLDPLFRGIYIMLFARSVLNGDLGSGTFVATLSAFGEVSESFREGYEEIMDIITDTIALQRLTQFLNRATDVKANKQVNRHRRAHTRKEREEALNRYAEQPFPTDFIDIKLDSVCFHYPDSTERFGNIPFTFDNINLSVPQGSIVAVCGDHGQGRHTFMRLLGQELFPTSGNVLVPSHLRILFVTQEPLLLAQQSFWENLCFGLAMEKRDEEKEVEDLVNRAKEIFTMMKSAKLIQILEEHSKELRDEAHAHPEIQESWCHSDPRHFDIYAPDSTWIKALSYSDKAMLHLARAFMMNPEMMVLQRPLLHFNNKDHSSFCDLIRLHVHDRGYGYGGDCKKRRPRTVFVSLAHASGEMKKLKGDVTWMVHSETETRHGVKILSINEMDPVDRASVSQFEPSLKVHDEFQVAAPVHADSAVQRYVDQKTGRTDLGSITRERSDFLLATGPRAPNVRDDFFNPSYQDK